LSLSRQSHRKGKPDYPKLKGGKKSAQLLWGPSGRSFGDKGKAHLRVMGKTTDINTQKKKKRCWDKNQTSRPVPKGLHKMGMGERFQESGP